ncbi:hypothetical protein GCM10023093_11850 [Nemorincola caseinilytica]|uniref:Outer membrane protein Omp28 n=1 Tax=Nemorincola caseinilytica TaxID=2054315 RepID=A0ABP8NCS4_9BACT
MKKYLLLMAVATLAISSCEEKAPNVRLTEPAIEVKDTTYVSTVPPAQPRNVLVEEYTGASCTNCPAAHEVLKEYQKQHPGRINVIGLYIKGPIQTVPPTAPHAAKYDFRHDDATSIAQNIYGGVSMLPSAGIDRLPVNKSIKLDRSTWGGAIENGLAMPDSINLALESTFDNASGIATIVATISYPMTITFAHNLNLVLVQDSIVDVQEYPTTDTVHPGGDEEYDFTNVLRTVITALPGGDAIFPNIPAKEPGRVIVRVYKYDTKNIADRTVNPKKQPPLVAAHCRIIGYITAASTPYRIMQSAQTTLK